MRNHSSDDHEAREGHDGLQTHNVTERVTKADNAQDEQIRLLKRKVGRAWLTAIFGPLLALVGVAFAGLQWQASNRQVELMRLQLKDAREGAEQARRDTDRALRVAEGQASSLRALANAASASAEAERVQSDVMARQAGLMQKQITDARDATAQTARIVADQLQVAEAQARSLKALAEATQLTADATKQNSAHAQRTVTVLEDTLHVQERAWVTFTDVQERTFYVPWVLPYRLTFQFNNVGRTPARNVRALIVRELADVPDKSTVKGNHGYYAVLGPGEKIYLTPPLVKRAADRRARRIAYVHGWITYDDIFGKQQRLDVCFMSPPGGGWRPCKEGSAGPDDGSS